MSLIMMERVPDSTYEMNCGLDKQIKEVIKLPVKHCELFEALAHGIARHWGGIVGSSYELYLYSCLWF